MPLQIGFFYLADHKSNSKVFLGVLCLVFFSFLEETKMDQCSAGTVEISRCLWPQNEISLVFFLVPFPRALAQLSERGSV